MAVEYDIDFRERPECYEIGRGERGVFKVQPYKSELLPLWSFKDEAAAKGSSEAVWAKFEAYRDVGDFVGMDMARKYLQMGYTRAMRYAKYPGGRKYADDGTTDEVHGRPGPYGKTWTNLLGGILFLLSTLFPEIVTGLLD